MAADKDRMNIVVIGHVDHGKSTVIGRLMADTNTLPDGKLEAIKNHCEKNSKTFEYAFLLDALENERDQGITIDMARCFLKSEKRHYIILDAPGHIEFLKNMISGASHAEAAVIVIDANEGIQENSLRHGKLVSLLGIKSVIVCVNKMDLIKNDQEKYSRIVEEYNEFLKSININPKAFIPVTAKEGTNLTEKNKSIPWYQEESLINHLDALEKKQEPIDQDFRFILQDVYKFTNFGDGRRILAGKVDAGRVKVGDQIIFFPSRKTSNVKSIERFNHNSNNAIAGECIGITLDEQIYVKRGEIGYLRDQKTPPRISNFLNVTLFWMGQESFKKDKKYLLKLGAQSETVTLNEISNIVHGENFKQSNQDVDIKKNVIADCILETENDLAFDLYSDNQSTGRFVIIDNCRSVGGGIINTVGEDQLSKLRSNILTRSLNFSHGDIKATDRSRSYGQSPLLVLLSGTEKSDIHKKIGKALETALFMMGRKVYYLSMGSIKYGLDLDLSHRLKESEVQDEVIRRLGELSYILLDAGLISIISLRHTSKSVVDKIKRQIQPHHMLHVNLTDKSTPNCETIEVSSGETNVSQVVEKCVEWMGNNEFFHKVK